MSWRRGEKSSISSATRRTRTAMSFWNRLRCRPFASAAASNASRSLVLGSGRSSMRCIAGMSSGLRPIGRSAARRIACSSKSSHASVIRTGTTLTSVQSASGISARLFAGSWASASRCTNRMSGRKRVIVSRISAAKSFRATRGRNPGSASSRSRECWFRAHAMTESRALSLVPSASSAKRSTRRVMRSASGRGAGRRPTA